MTDCSKFPNDPAVQDGTDLFRRIPHWQFYFDENENRPRPSSAAFEDDNDGDPMSVYLSQVLAAEERSPRTVLKHPDHDSFGLVSLNASFVRSNGQTIFPQPLADESSHALVCGDKRSGKKNAPKRKFAMAANWAVEVPGSRLTMTCPHCTRKQDIFVHIEDEKVETHNTDITCISCAEKFPVTTSKRLWAGPFAADG